MNTARHAQNFSTAGFTDRGRSPIFSKCPIELFLARSDKGIFLGDDLRNTPPHASTTSSGVSGALGRWNHVISQGGAIALVDTIGGALSFGSDGDNEVAILADPIGCFKITGGSAKTPKLWFECELRSSTIADTKHGIFCGLMTPNVQSATVPIPDDGSAMADTNFIGFWRREADGDQIDFTYKASGQTAQVPFADILTAATGHSAGLVADTYVKLGFIWDPNEPDATKRLRVYVNGLLVGSLADSATVIGAVTFPSSVSLGRVMAIKNATASTPGTTVFRYCDCAQAADLAL